MVLDSELTEPLFFMPPRSTKLTSKRKAPKPSAKVVKAKPLAQDLKSKTTSRKKIASSHKTKAAVAAARLVINAQGLIMHADQSFAAMLHLHAKDMIGQKARHIFSFVDPEDALHDRPTFFTDPKTDPWVQSIVAGAHDVVLTIAGHPHTVTLYFDQITLPDDRFFMIISRDDTTTIDFETLQSLLKIDAKKETETSIITLSSESSKMAAHLPIFFDMTHDMMVVMGIDGNLQTANEGFCEMLGVTPQDLTHLNFIEIVHPDDRIHIRPTFKSLIQDDAARERLIAFEGRIIGKDQKEYTLEWRQKRLGDLIYAVCRDLTDIKQHEMSLIQHQTQLSEAQRIGRMGHWIWRVGDDHLVWSDQIYRIFGVARDKFTPTIDNVNALLHRRDSGRMSQALQRAMLERKDYDMEFRIIRPDGQARFLNLQGKCEVDSDGDIIALFGIMQDVTERIQYERELKDAKEAAERAYAAKSQFLANMSHELRTPLNAIIGFSEMMQRQLLGPIGTEKYLDYISGIRESGEHLLDLITDILDMSKIEAGKYELDVEEFSLIKVLRLTAHMIEGRALDAQVKIFCSIPEDIELRMMADRRAVTQMILNLLSNAVKFTEPGGQVSLNYVDHQDTVSITVTDTGIGIPANKLQYVTQPFEQAANHFTRNHEGSGLGLAITKELIELHGGSIHIESTVGVGTSVTLRMPVNCQATRRDKKENTSHISPPQKISARLV